MTYAYWSDINNSDGIKVCKRNEAGDAYIDGLVQERRNASVR